MTETHYYTCDICTEQFNDDRMLLGFIIAPPDDSKTRGQLRPAHDHDHVDVHVCMSCARVVAVARDQTARVEIGPGPVRVMHTNRGDTSPTTNRSLKC